MHRSRRIWRRIVRRFHECEQSNFELVSTRHGRDATCHNERPNMNLLSSLAPELVLIAVACVLFFFGISHNPAVRRASALIAFVTLAAVFVWQLWDFLAYF